VSTSGAADPKPAKTDKEARERFLRYLNQTIQVVSPQAFWLASRTPSDASIWTAVTVPDLALRLRTGNGDLLYLRSTIQFSHVDREGFAGERKVSTLHYAHTVTTDEALQLERFSWQWHPSGWPYPHVHVYPDGDKGFGRLHVPTGRVFLEAIIIFLIHDLGVKPASADWEEIVRSNLSRVSRYATWGGLGELPQR
jgi:hypothetical protein